MLLIDFEKSDLIAMPQRLAFFCEACKFKSSAIAPQDADNGGLFWTLSDVRCRICEHEAVAVHPFSADEDNLECVNCGHMTAEAIDDEEEEIEGDDELVLA